MAVAETQTDTVVLLGTGATIGSGYTKCGKRLPGDRNFFDNDIVRGLLAGYPALNVMLNVFRTIHGEELSGLGLEAVWAFLEYGSQEPYHSLAELSGKREEWLQQISRAEAGSEDDHELTRRIRQDSTIPPADDIDLYLLAGWDLRRMLARVYEGVAVPSHRVPEENVYRKLISRYLKDDTTTFISLNYDLVLERALYDASVNWHYRTIRTEVSRNPKGIAVVKPHGSLNWRFTGNEPSVSISTDYSLEPVANRSVEENRFTQAMIVPPTQLKPEIHLPFTQSPKANALISGLFRSMSEALLSAKRVLVIGYSFPPTDQHIRTLLLQVNQERERRNGGGAMYDEVYCCTLANGGEEGRVFADVARFFPSRCFHPFDRGFEAFVS